jgi:cytochrome d ubiquinol oxidase subunit I
MAMPYYPVNDFGPVMKGLVIGGLGIFHVFTAQFAIGGGILMCYFQWLAQTGRSQNARRFLDSYFVFLVLLSFVIGAVTGVAMWFTAIQVSARTIGVMIDEFHWLWATEWTFFCLEVTAGYAFYRYGRSLNDRSRFRLLVLYAIAAWMSLFWINGILSFQLTPDGWVRNGSIWAGFFNPTFWPSLFYRTIAALVIASLVACVVINARREFSREQRAELINKAARLMVPVVLMPVFGLWFLAAMPADSRGWVLGGSVAMTLFMNLAVGASFVVGAYAIVGLVMQRLYINGATATTLAALALVATAGGEFVREGVRKPYTIRQHLFSNSITRDEVAGLRRDGITTNDPYPLREADTYPNAQLIRGAKVYRSLCSVCHTVAGVNGLVELTKTWATSQKRMNIAMLQRTKPFMPPFAGRPEEVEALVQWLEWTDAGRPDAWPDSSEKPEYRAVIRAIGGWLDEAGVEPATPEEIAAAIAAMRKEVR